MSEDAGAPSRDEMVSALFGSMVMQNTNMALIFLGQTPNPQTGQTVYDLENASYFIDQLEMLAVKTKGNLDKQEDAMLKQSLTHLRMAFVKAAENPPKAATPAEPAAATSATPPSDEQETPVTEPAPPEETDAESDSRKKFSKKY